MRKRDYARIILKETAKGGPSRGGRNCIGRENGKSDDILKGGLHNEGSKDRLAHLQ